MKKPTAISLFTGCGGCSLGVKQAGIKVLAATDLDTNCAATYQRNFPEVPFLRKDIRKITAVNLLNFAGTSGKDVDIVVGGPPCQGFTSAGSKNWDDPRNSLVKSFVEFVTTTKPTWFVMENVEGFLTSKHGFYLAEVVHQFVRAGYWVKVEKVNMAYYGIPQYRKRVFTVGNLEGVQFQFPQPTHLPKKPLPRFPLPMNVKEKSFDNFSPLVSVEDAIGNLPAQAEREPIETPEPTTEFQKYLHRSSLLYHHITKKLTRGVYKRIQVLQPEQRMKDLPESLQHPSYKRRAYRRVIDGTPTEKRGGPPAGLLRLRPNQPSLTISSAAPTEFVHPKYDRLLTLRECARIQTFPDDFIFEGSKSSITSQIGNAIPPLFMKILTEHIFSCVSMRSNSQKGRWLGIVGTYSKGMSPTLIKSLEAIERRARNATRKGTLYSH